VKCDSRFLAVIVPAAMYLISLMVPVADPLAAPHSSPQTGATAFRVAWNVMFLHYEGGWPLERLELVAAWWANPAIWAALISFAFGWRKPAMITAGAAAVLAMSVVPGWWEGLIHHPAFWLWWGSAIVTLLLATFGLPRRLPAFGQDYGPLGAPPTRPELSPAKSQTPAVP
jgi:hypothetical protein